jgi:hypothetical protein
MFLDWTNFIIIPNSYYFCRDTFLCYFKETLNKGNNCIPPLRNSINDENFDDIVYGDEDKCDLLNKYFSLISKLEEENVPVPYANFFSYFVVKPRPIIIPNSYYFCRDTFLCYFKETLCKFFAHFINVIQVVKFFIPVNSHSFRKLVQSKNILENYENAHQIK